MEAVLLAGILPGGLTGDLHLVDADRDAQEGCTFFQTLGAVQSSSSDAP